MLAIYDSYAKEYSISSNASKLLKILSRSAWKSPVVIWFSKKFKIYVGDDPIEYVDSFVHLGHVNTNQLMDNDDILKRLTEFIGQANNILCLFSKVKPSVVYKLFQSYCMHMGTNVG